IYNMKQLVEMNKAAVRYDAPTRVLHWLVAAGVLWMAITALARVGAPDAGVTKWSFSTHKTVGVLLLFLMVVRIAWSLIGRKRRPAKFSKAAAVGHFALYVLTLFVPLIGALRQYHSDRAFSMFGIEILAAG